MLGDLVVVQLANVTQDQRSGWARQLKDAGWNPGVVRLPSGHASGLLVGTDLTAWPDPTSSVPGVFAGLSLALGTGTAAPGLAHARPVCPATRPASSPLAPDWQGAAMDWLLRHIDFVQRSRADPNRRRFTGSMSRLDRSIRMTTLTRY